MSDVKISQTHFRHNGNFHPNLKWTSERKYHNPRDNNLPSEISLTGRVWEYYGTNQIHHDYPYYISNSGYIIWPDENIIRSSELPHSINKDGDRDSYFLGDDVYIDTIDMYI